MIFQIKNLIVRPVEKWKRTGILRKNAILHYPRSISGLFFQNVPLSSPPRTNPTRSVSFMIDLHLNSPGFTNPPQREKPVTPFSIGPPEIRNIHPVHKNSLFIPQ